MCNICSVTRIVQNRYLPNRIKFAMRIYGTKLQYVIEIQSVLMLECMQGRLVYSTKRNARTKK